MKIEELFGELFSYLDEVGYSWQPMIPDQLMKCRKERDSFSKLSQYFGLGIPLESYQLESEGLPSNLIPQVDSLRLAVSRAGRFYIPHSHWPSHPETADQYVHYGQESLLLTHQLYRYWSHFKGKRILDLGCGSGALALELGQVASEVQGLDFSQRAVEWAVASAHSQGSENVHFAQVEIGNRTHESKVVRGEWDIAVYNPPLAIPKENASFRHRDGGKWGIELPLLFLDFSEQYLKPFGEVFCLMSNPIVRGRSILFDQLKTRNWLIEERICLNDRFNHQLFREEQYAKQGVERIELYFLYLKKK